MTSSKSLGCHRTSLPHTRVATKSLERNTKKRTVMMSVVSAVVAACVVLVQPQHPNVDSNDYVLSSLMRAVVSSFISPLASPSTSVMGTMGFGALAATTTSSKSSKKRSNDSNHHHDSKGSKQDVSHPRRSKGHSRNSKGQSHGDSTNDPTEAEESGAASEKTSRPIKVAAGWEAHGICGHGGAQSPVAFTDTILRRDPKLRPLLLSDGCRFDVVSQRFEQSQDDAHRPSTSTSNRNADKDDDDDDGAAKKEEDQKGHTKEEERGPRLVLVHGAGGETGGDSKVVGGRFFGQPVAVPRGLGERCTLRSPTDGTTSTFAFALLRPVAEHVFEDTPAAMELQLFFRHLHTEEEEEEEKEKADGDAANNDNKKKNLSRSDGMEERRVDITAGVTLAIAIRLREVSAAPTSPSSSSSGGSHNHQGSSSSSGSSGSGKSGGGGGGEGGDHVSNQGARLVKHFVVATAHLFGTDLTSSTEKTVPTAPPSSPSSSSSSSYSSSSSSVLLASADAHPADLAHALPTSDQSFVTYSGSLPQPPCREGIRWFVLTAPVPVSSGLVRSYRALVLPPATTTATGKSTKAASSDAVNKPLKHEEKGEKQKGGEGSPTPPTKKATSTSSKDSSQPQPQPPSAEALRSVGVRGPQPLNGRLVTRYIDPGASLDGSVVWGRVRGARKEASALVAQNKRALGVLLLIIMGFGVVLAMYYLYTHCCRKAWRWWPGGAAAGGGKGVAGGDKSSRSKGGLFSRGRPFADHDNNDDSGLMTGPVTSGSGSEGAGSHATRWFWSNRRNSNASATKRRAAPEDRRDESSYLLQHPPAAKDTAGAAATSSGETTTGYGATVPETH